MSRSKARRPPRDMAVSPFAAILDELIVRMPGALGAALVDGEGECVDYAGRASPDQVDWVFDLKVAAAHVAIVLAEASSRVAARTVAVRATRRSFVARALVDGYALIVLLGRRAGFTSSARALDLCAAQIAAEAGWSGAEGPQWFPVRVECRGKAPARVAGLAFGMRGGAAPRMHAVVVLGTLVVHDPRERGFRVRLDTGAELTVVREAGGFWYADEPIPLATARSLEP